ncbi:MAG: DUF4349 domain-containing protein [Candidatus Zipacnadales bacterium]
MSKGMSDSFESPLDELLSQLPQEEPPPELKARCLQVVRPPLAPEVAPTKLRIWPIVWKGATSLAAAFLALVVAIALLPRQQALEEVAHTPTSTPQTMRELPEAGLSAAGNLRWRAAASPEIPRSAPDAADRLPELKAPGQASQEGTIRRPLNQDLTFRNLSPLPGEADVANTVPYQQPLAPPHADYEETSSGVGHMVARPWRDESGERKRMLHTDMKIEVNDVEDAHERATAIIGRAEGYVEREELRLNPRGESEAVLYARVPVKALEGVIAQLRKLGKTISLYGESEDRTDEYYARGLSIRELAEREVALVAEYERETNRSRRQQLKWEIDALRAQIRQQKSPLKALSKEVHFASLTLTIVRARGPRQFLYRLAENVPTAAAWVAISAIFWIPTMVTIIAVWRRVAGRSAVD